MSEMNDRELLEYIATHVAGLTTKVDGLTTTVDGLTTKVDGLTTKVDDLTVDVSGLKDETKKINTRIDHEVMPKINALFDGYKQNSDILDRIEEKVSRHEEIIVKRAK